MAGPVTVDRRAWPRMAVADRVHMVFGRHRPGRHAFIIDVCPGGALIETDYRLSPGMPVELIFEPWCLSSCAARARVLRCHVALLGRENIRYHGALAFDAPVQLDGNLRPAGSSCTPPIASHSR